MGLPENGSSYRRFFDWRDTPTGKSALRRDQLRRAAVRFCVCMGTRDRGGEIAALGVSPVLPIHARDARATVFRVYNRAPAAASTNKKLFACRRRRDAGNSSVISPRMVRRTISALPAPAARSQTSPDPSNCLRPTVTPQLGGLACLR